MTSALHPLAELGVIVVAAGRGHRLGAEQPKAFIDFAGRTLLEHAIDSVIALPHSGQLVLVIPESHAAETLSMVDALVPPGSPWQVSVVPGGRERHESVRFGLAALADSIRTVLIHDAARPLTPAEVFERVIAEVHRVGHAVIPVIPVTDTIKRIVDGVVTETVDRATLFAAQTPQGFPRALLEAAHQSAQAREAAAPPNDAPTDDAEVVQRFGGVVSSVAGDQRSHKVTTSHDLRMLTALLSEHPTSTPKVRR